MIQQKPMLKHPPCFLRTGGKEPDEKNSSTHDL